MESGEGRAYLRSLFVDWGTTARRVFGVGRGGTILYRRAEPLGVLQVSREQLVGLMAALKDQADGRPILLAGMIGSDRGLAKAPYTPCPARLVDLAALAIEIEPGIRIVPGVSMQECSRQDVMRGEELIVLGGVAAGLVPSDGLICQPGTHNKWISLANGEIRSFRTMMTGELFNLLGQHGTLSALLSGDAPSDENFARGVRQGLDGYGAFAELFSIRAAAMLGEPGPFAPLVSGLLIGDDIRVGSAGHSGPIIVVGSGPLAAHYRSAIAIAGFEVRSVDAEQCFVAGATKLAELWSWM